MDDFTTKPWFRTPSQYQSRIRPAIITRILEALPDEFTFKQAYKVMSRQARLSGLTKGGARAKITLLKEAKAITSKRDPKDGRKVIYVKAKQYRNNS